MAGKESKKKYWSGTGQTRGGRWGIWLFITLIRVLGRKFTYCIGILPVMYFTFASPDVAATMDFHRRAFGPQPWWKRRWLVFRHFCSFGRAWVDRTAILAGQKGGFRFDIDSHANLGRTVAEGKGVLLLTGHVGNWEAAGQMLTGINVPVTVTGFDKESPVIRKMLDGASKQKFKLLPLTGSPTDVIPLVAALRRGEVVAMLGDRSYGSPSAKVPFYGGVASFPIGAYVIAAIAGSALMHVFSVREGDGYYRFFGFDPHYPKMPAHDLRDTYLKECAARFAADLEFVVRRDPFQWYNFYPFWDEDLAEYSPKPSDDPALCPSRSKA